MSSASYLLLLLTRSRIDILWSLTDRAVGDPQSSQQLATLRFATSSLLATTTLRNNLTRGKGNHGSRDLLHKASLHWWVRFCLHHNSSKLTGPGRRWKFWEGLQRVCLRCSRQSASDRNLLELINVLAPLSQSRLSMSRMRKMKLRISYKKSPYCQSYIHHTSPNIMDPTSKALTFGSSWSFVLEVVAPI